MELKRQNEEIKLKAEADQAQLEKEREEARKKAEEDLQLLRGGGPGGKRTTSQGSRGNTSKAGRCSPTTGIVEEGK